MTAQVIPFPNKRSSPSYTISLYGDDEINMIIAAINLFSEQVTGQKYFQAAYRNNLKSFKPVFVIECLKAAYESDIFSTKGRKIITNILANVNEEQDAVL